MRYVKNMVEPGRPQLTP